MTRDEIDEVIASVSQHGSYIFSDEVYRFSEYNEEDRLPALCDIYDRAISLGVMSKSLGLPGLRIGWIATRDRDAFNRIARIKDYITICNSAPSEFLASIALRNIEFVSSRCLGILKSNLTILDQFFDQYQAIITWVRPKAGPISLAELIPSVDMEIFSKQLRDKEGVLILPGSIFDYNNQHFRLGFGRLNMPQALDRFSNFLDKQF